MVAPSRLLPGTVRRGLFFLLLSLVCLHLGQAQAALQIETRWDNKAPRRGSPFLLLIDVHWTGAADRFAISTPELDLPEGISLTRLSSSTYSRGEETFLTYTVTLLSEQEGTFDPIPISFVVYERESSQPSTMVVKTDPLTIPKGPRTTIPIRYLVPLACLGTAFAVVAGILIVRRQARKKTISTMEDRQRTGDHLWQFLDEAHTYLIRGDSLSFLETLLTIEHYLQEKEPALSSELVPLVEKTRYGGFRPEPQELERMYRSFARRINQQFPRKRDHVDVH